MTVGTSPCRAGLQEEVGCGDGAGGAGVGRGDRVGGVADGEHVVGVDALGKGEGLCGDGRVKGTDPAGAQAQLGGLHHHLVADDRRVDGRGREAVGAAGPGLALDRADDEDERGAKDAAVALEARLGAGGRGEALGRVAREHARGVLVAGGRGDAAGLDDEVEVRARDGLVGVAAARVAREREVCEGYGSPIWVGLLLPSYV